MSYQRFFDIAASTVGIIFTAPLVAVVAASVALTFGFPIIIKQKRVGQDGNVFEMYKFRTRSNNPELQNQHTHEAPWKQSFGKFLRRRAFDEFPQFINVIKGDMTLVGCRPCTPEEFENVYKRKGYAADYARNKPGITGLGTIKSIGNANPLSIADKLADCRNIPTGLNRLSVLFASAVGVVILGHGGNEPATPKPANVKHPEPEILTARLG